MIGNEELARVRVLVHRAVEIASHGNHDTLRGALSYTEMLVNEVERLRSGIRGIINEINSDHDCNSWCHDLEKLIT